MTVGKNTFYWSKTLNVLSYILFLTSICCLGFKKTNLKYQKQTQTFFLIDIPNTVANISYESKIYTYISHSWQSA